MTNTTINAAEKTMTKREFYTAIAENESLSAEVREFATACVAKLDEVNEKRRNAVSKKEQENAPLKELLVAALTAEPQTATDLAPVIEGSVQKTSALLRQLVADGKAAVQDVKVKSKGVQKGYTIVG